MTASSTSKTSSDHLLRIVSEDGRLRGAAALTTGLAEEIRRRQGTDPTATVAIGRLATGAALLGSLLKGEQRLAVSMEGNGPLRKLFAETDAHGRVRASIKVPQAGLPPREGRYDVAGAIGKAGFLHVTKDLGLKEPYHGMVQLYSSEVAEDLAWYLTTSEQVPSSVALGVSLQDDGKVATAGGFLVQSLPPADENRLELLEERLLELPPVTELLRDASPRQILERIFADISFRMVEEIPLSFHCTCSRQQAMRMLRLLGEEELRSLAARTEETTVTCEYCRETYTFTPGEIRTIPLEE